MLIHETAFLTCAYRSSEPSLSGDVYAALWHNPDTDKWVHAVTEEVSVHEPFLHCLRNRFFLDQMTTFFTSHPDGVLVNFGAGFSMYPYLFPSDVPCMDIDQTDIVQYKSKVLSDWTAQHKIPPKEITYYDADFRKEDVSKMISDITAWIDGRPSFFVLEGVLYFLSKEVTDRLFYALASIQKSGDILGCVSFLPEAKDTAVQIRLNEFFDRHNFANDTFSHQMLSHESYQTRNGYTLIDHKNYCDLSLQYAPDRAIYDKASILNENMYLLKKDVTQS